MVSTKQRKAAKVNIRKALGGRARKKPGTGGKGKYYRIVVRPKSEFSSFRAHDVGRKGHAIRLAGRRKTGSWDTQAWLISKKDAHVANGILMADEQHANKVLANLRTKPKLVKGDVFEAKDRRNVPEKSKPTPAMKKAQRRNIKKAQAVRRKKKRR